MSLFQVNWTISELQRLISGQLSSTVSVPLVSGPVSESRVSVFSSIFEDIGDYIPPATSKPSKDKDRHRGRDEDSKSRRHAYFEKPRGDEHPLTEVETGMCPQLYLGLPV